MLLYVDTSVVISFVERAISEREASIAAALNERLRENPLLCWTDLTRLECIVSPLRARDAALLADYDAFFAQTVAHWLPLSRAVFDRAAHLRADHRLKTPDALHLAAAIEGGCDEFWTSDNRLDAAASGYLRTLVLWEGG